MIANKDVELLEKSAVKLTITVGKDDVKSKYDELVQKYCKQAQIPGFRKGKVPATVLITKFGDSIKAETLHNVVDASLQEAFEAVEEKPLQYGQPELLDENLDIDPEKELVFSVKYDTFPKVEVKDYKGVSVEEPGVSITKADEERELKQIQEQNAIVMDKESATVAKDNIVTIDFVELDDSDNEIEGTRREDFVFTVGTGYNLYKIDDDIIRMKKDKEKVIEKTYPEDFEYKELAGKTVKLKVKIKAVKEKQLPEINDELAQDINDEFETLDDLKKDIKKKLEEQAQAKIRESKVEAIMEKLIEATEIDLPESMINAEMEQALKNISNQYRMSPEQLGQFLAANGKDGSFADEMKPGVMKELKRRLILGQIIEAEKIEATEEEIDAEISKQAQGSKMSLEEAKNFFKQNNMMDYLGHAVKDRKVVDFLLDSADVKKGKKVKFLDLMDQKQ